jgi:hypothetical protein
MKLTFECVNAGRKSVERKNGAKVEKVIVYYASFAKTVEPNMIFFGSFNIESIEPLHYKPTQKYDLNIGEHIVDPRPS